MSGSAVELYQEDVKALAKDTSHSGKLENADYVIKEHNPLCGDTVELSIALVDEKITAIKHKVKGCLLCKASASLLAKHAVGVELASFKQFYQQLNASLQSDIIYQHKPWSDLKAFQPIINHKSRHNCLLLPFKALAKIEY